MIRFSMAPAIGGLAVASLMGLLLAQSSSAQETDVWTHPGGIYQLNYGSAGWKIGKPFSHGGRSAVVTFEPRRPNEAGSCQIFEVRLSLPAGVEQSRANQYMSLYTGKDWAAALSYDPARIQFFADDMVEGVRVVTMVVDALKPSPHRAYFRSFVALKPDGAYHQELSCKIGPGARESDAKTIANFIYSLHFIATPADE